jgi:hypothetical protein
VATRRLEPGQRPDIEHRLTELGFTWEYHPGLPLDEFNSEKSLRNQARLGNPLKPDVVDRYRAALANGAKFPAVVAATQPSGGHLIVDGNHRYAACSQRKGIDTYLIIDGDPQGITMLTFESNTTHGLATSEEERLHQALWMVDNGMSMEEAARRVGLRSSTVRSANTMHQAAMRADAAGIDRREWDRLSVAHRQRLSAISTDEGFAGLTKMAIAAKLSTAEVNEHVKTMGELRSSNKQHEYTEALRDMYATRLQRGGSPAPKGQRGINPKAMLAMGLGQIMNLPMAAVAERLTDTEREDIRKKVRAARERLQELESFLS